MAGTGIKFITLQESDQHRDSVMSVVPEGCITDDFSDVWAIKTCQWNACAVINMSNYAAVIMEAELH